MLSTREETEKAFRSAEANLRLEGMDPSGHPFYEDLKARVIKGELSFESAKDEIFKFCTGNDKAPKLCG